MKITEQELNHLLAEVDGDNVVPVFCDNGALSHYEVINLETGESLGEYQPTRDERHALQVLMEFRKNSNPHRIVIDLIDQSDFIEVSIYQMPSPWATTESDQPNLCHAICLAVAEAETGNKYELVKE